MFHTDLDHQQHYHMRRIEDIKEPPVQILVPDSQLARQLQLTERTMRDYDKSARNLTLEKVDIFLQANHMELHDLLIM